MVRSPEWEGLRAAACRIEGSGLLLFAGYKSPEPRTQNLRPLCGREVRKRDLQDQAGRYLIFGPNRQKYLLETVFQA